MHRFCKSLIHHYQHILITMIDKFGIEYSEDGTTLKRCPKDFKGTFQIPDSVTSIESSAFEGCTGLTSIEIPNSVTSIEDFAFSGCTGLTSIQIPNSVTSIEWGTFDGCTGLTSIEIPNSVIKLELYSFKGCRSLRRIIPTTAPKTALYTPKICPNSFTTASMTYKRVCFLKG